MATAVQIIQPVTSPKVTAVLSGVSEDNGFALAFQALLPGSDVADDPAPADDSTIGTLPEGKVASDDAKTPPDPQALPATTVLPIWQLTLAPPSEPAPVSPAWPAAAEPAEAPAIAQVQPPVAAASREVLSTGDLPMPVLANPRPAPFPPAVVPLTPTPPDLPVSAAPVAPPQATDVGPASGTQTQPRPSATALSEHKVKAVSKALTDPAKADQSGPATLLRQVADGAIAGVVSTVPSPMPTTAAPMGHPIGQTAVQSLFESRARDHATADRGDFASADLPPADLPPADLPPADLPPDASRPQAGRPTPLLAKPAASQPAVPGLVQEQASFDAQLSDQAQFFFPTAITGAPMTPLSPAIAPPLAAVLPQILHLIANPSHRVTEVALAPEELGHVRLSLRAHDTDPDRIVVMMMFERPEAMDLFRRNADQLQADLRAAGYSGADLSFSHSGSGKPQDQPSPGPEQRTLTVAEPPPAVFAPLGPRTSSASLDLRL